MIPLWKHEAKGLPLTARHAAAVLARMEGDDAALAAVRLGLANRGKPIPQPASPRGRIPRADRSTIRVGRTVSLPQAVWDQIDALRGFASTSAYIEKMCIVVHNPCV